MPVIKPSQQHNRRRQKVQRPSSKAQGIKRLGLVASLVVCFTVGLWAYLNAPYLSEAANKYFEDVTIAMGFQLEDVVVQGRLRTSKNHILTVADLQKGKPLFSINLNEVKTKLEDIHWIKLATIERKLPDTLYIKISEKQPIALWMNDSKTYLLDKDGDIIETEEPFKYPELIVMTGQDVPESVGKFVDLLDQYPEIKTRVTGATYLRAHRWDIQLDDKIEVKLPENDAEQALDHLVKLEKEHQVTAKDISAIDLRLPNQLILRLTPEAVKQKNTKGHEA